MLSGPLIVVLPFGMTDSTVDPSVTCWIVNAPVTSLPLVTSVARIVAICVTALTLTASPTSALPIESVTTVCVGESGSAGLDDWIA